jgi:hypothetical protein
MRRFGLTLVWILAAMTSSHMAMSQAAEPTHWVDSVFNTLSLEEKIGQLFIIRAHSDLGEDHVQSVQDQIQKYHIGGLCFFQGTPKKTSRTDCIVSAVE